MKKAKERRNVTGVIRRVMTKKDWLGLDLTVCQWKNTDKTVKKKECKQGRHIDRSRVNHAKYVLFETWYKVF